MYEYMGYGLGAPKKKKKKKGLGAPIGNHSCLSAPHLTNILYMGAQSPNELQW